MDTKENLTQEPEQTTPVQAEQQTEAEMVFDTSAEVQPVKRTQRRSPAGAPRDGRQRRRAEGDNPDWDEKRKPRKTRKKAAAKKDAPADAGYQPYRAANKRRKAQKAGKVKNFFAPVTRMVQRLTDKGDTFADNSEIAIRRREQREAEEAKKRKKQSLFNTPAIVYTQPRAFNRDRLLVQLLTVLAIVMAFVLGLSVFFKVKVITVTGAEVYSPWAVREASGINEGDNLLTFGRAKASGQITANLPYVKSVRIGIKLPDTVNIEIDEEDVVYAIKSEEGIWWLINSEGKVVDMSNNSQAKNYTQVLGVTITNPQKNEYSVATEEVAAEVTDENGEETEFIPLTTTGAQRLSAALQILKALEANDVVGDAASVDVTRLEDIILWYSNRYQVNLGDTSQMEYKIACMVDAILQMSDYQTGVLDISFTVWPDMVGYTPFQ